MSSDQGSGFGPALVLSQPHVQMRWPSAWATIKVAGLPQSCTALANGPHGAASVAQRERERPGRLVIAYAAHLCRNDVQSQNGPAAAGAVLACARLRWEPLLFGQYVRRFGTDGLGQIAGLILEIGGSFDQPGCQGGI